MEGSSQELENRLLLTLDLNQGATIGATPRSMYTLHCLLTQDLPGSGGAYYVGFALPRPPRTDHLLAPFPDDPGILFLPHSSGHPSTHRSTLLILNTHISNSANVYEPI